ncbi:MAG: hypothetical protein JWP30_1749, partial [Homoserinimonas sp.]|nr:hypothetical protein [Homoserinimonas sp.]
MVAKRSAERAVFDPDEGAAGCRGGVEADVADVSGVAATDLGMVVSGSVPRARACSSGEANSPYCARRVLSVIRFANPVYGCGRR